MIELDFRGDHKTLSVVASPWSISVNQPPYYLRRFFAHKVEPDTVHVAIHGDAKLVTVQLEKAVGTMWGGAVFMEDADALAAGIPELVESWRLDKEKQVCFSAS